MLKSVKYLKTLVIILSLFFLIPLLLIIDHSLGAPLLSLQLMIYSIVKFESLILKFIFFILSVICLISIFMISQSAAIFILLSLWILYKKEYQERVQQMNMRIISLIIFSLVIFFLAGGQLSSTMIFYLFVSLGLLMVMKQRGWLVSRSLETWYIR